MFSVDLRTRLRDRVLNLAAAKPRQIRVHHPSAYNEVIYLTSSRGVR